MAQCWKCGGQMPAYAVRCSWCGRSTTVSAFFQVISITAIVVAALIVAGVLPMARVRQYIPGLETTASPLPPRDQTVQSGGGSGSGKSPGGYGTVGSAAPAEQTGGDSRNRQGPAAPGGTMALKADVESTCDAPALVATLTRQHPDWAVADVVLVSCGRVRTGFTAEQVRASLGRPLRVMEPGGESVAEVWVYRTRRVVMERGVVVSVRE